MKYIEQLGITLISVTDSTDDAFAIGETSIQKVPKRHLVITLPDGKYDGERKELILAENKNDILLFIHCNAKVSHVKEFHSFVLKVLGQSIALIWSNKFASWYVAGSDCKVVDDMDYNRWLQDPISVDIDDSY
jgi:hypothetical protein